MSVRGDDIDTDRIIPARFLRCVTFDGIGEHAFEDDRKAQRDDGGSGGGEAAKHPFDQERFQGASVLVVNGNFGCGSSREHAPQSLWRWGIHGIVGESFAEIFFGNCVALGVPCFTLAANDIRALQGLIEDDASTTVTLDVESRDVFATSKDVETFRARATLSDGTRHSFLSGVWDVTTLLLADSEDVAAVADRVPYVAEFKKP